MNELVNRLQSIKEKWQDLELQLNDPRKIADQRLYVQLNKSYKELQKVVEEFEKYKVILSNIENNRHIIETEKDDEFKQMAKGELDGLEDEKLKSEEAIRLLLLPKDPTDEKNAVIEIRAGTGGDEASLFAGELYRMYIRYCENKKWKLELVSDSPGTMGGYKEVIFEVTGENVYGTLKFESGVHRVQRVPATEAQGRVHTSAQQLP